MRSIRNDRKAYKTRESLSSPLKPKKPASGKKVEFEFELVGHYIKRKVKSTP